MVFGPGFVLRDEQSIGALCSVLLFLLFVWMSSAGVWGERSGVCVSRKVEIFFEEY